MSSLAQGFYQNSRIGTQYCLFTKIHKVIGLNFDDNNNIWNNMKWINSIIVKSNYARYVLFGIVILRALQKYSIYSIPVTGIEFIDATKITGFWFAFSAINVLSV